MVSRTLFLVAFLAGPALDGPLRIEEMELPTPEVEDAALLAQVAERSGQDNPAMAELQRRHHGALLGYCTRRLGNSADAEDACAEAWKGVWTSAASFRAGSSVRTWIWSIARRKCIDITKGRDPIVLDLLEESPFQQGKSSKYDTPPQLAFQREVWNACWDEVGKLSDRERQIIYMTCQGVRGSEIARRLGITTNSVKTGRCQAAEKLRDRLLARGIQHSDLEVVFPLEDFIDPTDADSKMGGA